MQCAEQVQNDKPSSLQASDDDLRSGMKTMHQVHEQELRREYKRCIGRMLHNEAESQSLQLETESETQSAFNRLHQLLATFGEPIV
jgi:hypothetical protein